MALSTSVNDIFPLLLPQDTDLSSYQGYISIQGKEFLFRIRLPSSNVVNRSNPLRGASLECGKDLKELLAGSEDVIKKRLLESKDISSFLIELKDVLEKVIRNKKAQLELPPVPYYSRLLEELNEIGWKRVKSVDTPLTRLEIKLSDAAKRIHTFVINIPPDYPQSQPTTINDLPGPIPGDLRWNLASSRLTDIVQHYEKGIEAYQDFWNVVGDLDHNTWILEPEHPTYAATMRRIALGNHCSMLVQIDPMRCRMIPINCQFMGSDNYITPLRENFNKNITKWNGKLFLRENLEAILSIQFPSPKSTSKEQFSEECGICYSYRLENAIPERVCDNDKCSKPFHRSCLFEWLRAIPSSRQSFDTIFGECPYCSSPISVKMASSRI